MPNNIYLADEGLILRIHTDVDLTGATTKQFKVRRPDDSEVTWTATTYGNDSDGVLQYAIQSGDLTVSGIYYLQAYLIYNTGEKLYGDTIKIPVLDVYT